jgi:hypothetical protein
MSLPDGFTGNFDPRVGSPGTNVTQQQARGGTHHATLVALIDPAALPAPGKEHESGQSARFM